MACTVWLGSAASGQWSQTHELWSADVAPGDYFGFSVSISEGVILAGAWRDDDAGIWSGSAYLFDATTGAQLHKLTAEDAAADDQFGVNVSIHGSTCIVGAQKDDDAGLDSGSAYLFDVTTGGQLHKLVADDIGPGDQFGNPVAIGEGVALVGTFFADDPGIDTGAVYLFDTTTGQQMCKLIAEDVVAGDHFGRSVDIHGNIAIVGATQSDSGGTGAAYLFDVTTCEQLHKLTPNDGVPGDRFGKSVGIDGDWAVVGAETDSDAGSVYVFGVASGLQLRELTASDGEAGDEFGREVSVDDGIILIGARRDDHVAVDAGSAYLFDADTGVQLDKLTADDAATNDQMGRSVALSGTTAVVSAHRHNHMGLDSGSVFVFDPACPADLDDDGIVGVTDLVALVLAWGPCLDCPHDLNGDGTVDVTDLVEIILRWGPC